MVKGIVRKLDDLGRATLPIEMRRALGFVAGEPVDMWLDNGTVRVKLYDKDLTKGVVRRIDDLGRIVIPMEYRRSLSIGERDSIDMYLDGQVICVEQAKAKCVFCGTTDRDKLIEHNGKHVCMSCIESIRQEAMKG